MNRKWVGTQIQGKKEAPRMQPVEETSVEEKLQGMKEEVFRVIGDLSPSRRREVRWREIPYYPDPNPNPITLTASSFTP